MKYRIVADCDLERALDSRIAARMQEKAKARAKTSKTGRVAARMQVLARAKAKRALAPSRMTKAEAKAIMTVRLKKLAARAVNKTAKVTLQGNE